jgi:carbamate kinase
VTPPLLVVALGGNALSPPRAAPDPRAERERIAAASRELAGVAGGSSRLLVVHGNGPQVGRLLEAPGLGGVAELDVHVARTQGELGYLLAETLEAVLGAPCAAVVTRVLVAADDPAFAAPTKPIGPVLAAPPSGVPSVRAPDGDGFRRVVASPRPAAVLEERAVADLLVRHHVVAGGGGGVALATTSEGRVARAAVIDKDFVASLLARRLGAERLLFVTDVAHAYEGFGGAAPRALPSLTPAEARRRLARGEFAPGSMAPKMEAAVEFAEATGRGSWIAPLGGVAAALRGEGGTCVAPA